MHAPGSRSTRPLTVAITDDAGNPVRGAAVSFHLPEEGPSGIFPNGLRTDVVTTDERGRATLRALQWNRVSGRLQIRIFASKEQVRAGVVSFQYIAEPGSGAARASTARSAPREPEQGVSRGRWKWIAVAALAGGGLAAGLLATRGHGPGSESLPNPPVTIGTPSITVGKP